MLRNYKIWLCTSIVLLIALIATYRTLDTTKNDLQALKETKIDTSITDNKTTLTSEIQASQKVSESEPDLILDTKYTAQLNGHKVTVPIKKTTVATSNTDKPKGGTNVTARVTQELDVSNLVKPLLPDWEVGVGIGVHDSHVYVPVAIQRNYKIDRAVEAVIHLDSHNSLKPNGITIMHKWKF